MAEQVSLGVRQMCCRVAIAQQGYGKASEHLENLAQIRISPERLRQIAQGEGRKVVWGQAKGQLPASFGVEDVRGTAGGPSRIYVGADGVKVPMVTIEEKAKRRRQRGRRRAGSPPRRMHEGADNSYKEFKIAVFYDEFGVHRQVVTTAGDHSVLGRLVRRQGQGLGLNRFEQKLGLGDGADWVCRQLMTNLPMLEEFILDFYHFSEHVWSAGHACYGVNSERALGFAGEILHKARHEGPASVLAALESYRKADRSRTKREALGELIQYIVKRAGQCDYPRYLAAGWQIGSGPTEAMCKVLTYRLKGSGMRWDREGAEPMMALLALEQSNTWETYWKGRGMAA